MRTIPTHTHRLRTRRLATIGMLAAAGGLYAASTGAAANADGTQLGPAAALVGPTGFPQAVIASAGAPGGAEAFAWTLWSKPGFPNGRGRVQVRLRRPDGRLTAAHDLSAARGRAFLPAIGVDRAGAAIAAWLQQTDGHRLVPEVALGRPDGRFGPPRVLGAMFASDLPERDESDPKGVAPQLAVAPDGTAVLAWSTPRSLLLATRRPRHCAAAARACFSAVQHLPAGSAPRIAFGAHDIAYLVWESARGIQLAVARPGQRFGTPRLISPEGESAREPSIGLTPDGTAVVAWRWGPPGSMYPSEGIEVASRSAAGAVSAPVKLSAAPISATSPVGVYSAPTVLVDPQGEALIDWVQVDYSIAESVRARNGAFSSSRIVGTVLGNEPMVMDGHGDTVLAYAAGPYAEAFWSVRPPGGVFGSSQLLPDSGSGPPFLVPRSADTVTVGWTTRSGTRIADIRVG